MLPEMEPVDVKVLETELEVVNVLLSDPDAVRE